MQDNEQSVENEGSSDALVQCLSIQTPCVVMKRVFFQLFPRPPPLFSPYELLTV